jgi:hypothetical protein
MGFPGLSAPRPGIVRGDERPSQGEIRAYILDLVSGLSELADSSGDTVLALDLKDLAARQSSRPRDAGKAAVRLR